MAERRNCFSRAGTSLIRVLRLSTLFLRTLRDDPADAEVPSHKLLVRAGYVRRVAPGIYSWLPLGHGGAGQRRADRARGDGRDRLAGGALPGADPARDLRGERPVGRLRRPLFRLHDRKDADYLLAPTHEELFTLLVKGEYSSYKDYPLALYQIQTKYRDEARPRAGILRGREFIMKDSYSFDLSHEGLEKSYRAHRDAYERIFTRLGFDLPDRLRGVRRDGRLGVGGVPRAGAVRRGHLRPVHELRLRGQHRGRRDRRAASRTTRPTTRPQQVLDTPDTPTIDTLVDR